MIRRTAAALAVVLLATGCNLGDGESAAKPRASSGATSGRGASGSPAAQASDTPVATDDPALDVAVSTPRQDPVYPQVGNPVVDALHYQLDLSWSPAPKRLTGHETLVFRAARDSNSVPLDMSAALTVSGVTVDGEEVDFEQRGQDLVVAQPVDADDRHTLVIDYQGTPRPVAAPTTRSDFSTNGWTITDGGGAWTMQEPYGALTWYAVNDQPADKALYDFTLTVPSSMVGVANGELTRDDEEGGFRTTRWHLSSPASSYLVTVAFDDLAGPSARVEGVPISVWGPSARRALSRVVLKSAKKAMPFLTERLGPYPFDSLGFLLVDSFSGMETQTMITLGAPSGYTTSDQVVVHEMAHQWYGDQVTPSSWRDVWLSEGMAMYIQLVWQADHGDGSVSQQLAEARGFSIRSLHRDGPPADWDPTAFGESNVYYVPAMMWETLRQQLGDQQFWRLVRAWPSSHARGNADYATFTRWWSQRAGKDLRPFFDSWLKSSSVPEVPVDGPNGRGGPRGSGPLQLGSPGMA